MAQTLSRSETAKKNGPGILSGPPALQKLPLCIQCDFHIRRSLLVLCDHQLLILFLFAALRAKKTNGLARNPDLADVSVIRIPLEDDLPLRRHIRAQLRN